MDGMNNARFVRERDTDKVLPPTRFFFRRTLNMNEILLVVRADPKVLADACFS
jgi:hypothetical protein